MWLVFMVQGETQEVYNFPLVRFLSIKIKKSIFRRHAEVKSQQNHGLGLKIVYCRYNVFKKR